ncbi:MAG: DarT ssDNA thymidine ADP-ribosyltransferase family protein [Candidatus Saccharibacteria bacterium]|nr:DarT ssDNA thymidine ADP-ribosyltransferase family protein [Candidatus Saccharibacteria bacterium]
MNSLLMTLMFSPIGIFVIMLAIAFVFCAWFWVVDKVEDFIFDLKYGFDKKETSGKKIKNSTNYSASEESGNSERIKAIGGATSKKKMVGAVSAKTTEEVQADMIKEVGAVPKKPVARKRHKKPKQVEKIPIPSIMEKQDYYIKKAELKKVAETKTNSVELGSVIVRSDGKTFFVCEEEFIYNTSSDGMNGDAVIYVPRGWKVVSLVVARRILGNRIGDPFYLDASKNGNLLIVDIKRWTDAPLSGFVRQAKETIEKLPSDYDGVMSFYEQYYQKVLNRKWVKDRIAEIEEEKAKNEEMRKWLAEGGTYSTRWEKNGKYYRKKEDYQEENSFYEEGGNYDYGRENNYGYGVENDYGDDEKKYVKIYHLTPLDNLESIQKDGILSRAELVRKNKRFRDIAALGALNNHDDIYLRGGKQVRDYARCFFNPLPPMYYVRKDEEELCVVELKIPIREENGKLKPYIEVENLHVKIFRGSIATQCSRGGRVMDLEIWDLNEVEWDASREAWNLNKEREKLRRGAEILIYPRIPAKYIDKIYEGNLEFQLRDKQFEGSPIRG